MCVIAYQFVTPTLISMLPSKAIAGSFIEKCTLGFGDRDAHARHDCRGIEKTFMEKDMQDERGTYDPAYLNYTIGKLMIRKLRADYTKSDKSKWKVFHDKFLSYGGPSIQMVRKAILGKDDKGSLF